MGFADTLQNYLWLSLRKLIVNYGLIDHEFCYQFLKFMWFQTLKIALAEWKMYSINYMVQLTFYHLQKLVLGNIISFRSLGSHVNFPQDVLMAAFYRFICTLVCWMSTINVCLIERSVQNFFSRSLRLVVMVITTILRVTKDFASVWFCSIWDTSRQFWR